MDQQFQLNDGRTISYSVFGGGTGHPVLFFHGSFGSRYEAGCVEELAQNQQIQLIAYDRPGYGHSDPKIDRTIQSDVQDVEELLDHLRLDQVDIIGASGGAPYALACAEKLRSRVGKVVIICGLVPFDTDEMKAGVADDVHTLIKAAQFAPEQLSQQVKHIHEHPNELVEGMNESLPRIDQEVLNEDIKKMLVKAFYEGTRSPEGIISEHKIYGNPWNVDFSQIDRPVYFFHGDEDHTIHAGVARKFSDRIKGSRFETIEEAGHLGSAVVAAEKAFKMFVE